MNLIICTTPLQVKIAERIMSLYPEDSFYKVYLSPDMNSKHHYYSRHFDLVVELTSIDLFEGIVNQLTGDYDRIIFASFDHPIISRTVLQSTYQSLVSFDDGLSSISRQSIYLSTQLNQKQEGYLTPIELIELTEKHFTIYKTPFHIVDREKLVYLDSLFPFEKVKRVKNGKTLKIILGQNVSEDNEVTKRFIRTYGAHFKIDQYFPHPKAGFQLDSFQEIDSPLIIEDYLLFQMTQYESIEVYHFYSSSALHLHSVEGIEVIGMDCLPVKPYQDELRSLGCTYLPVRIDWF